MTNSITLARALPGFFYGVISFLGGIIMSITMLTCSIIALAIILDLFFAKIACIFTGVFKVLYLTLAIILTSPLLAMQLLTLKQLQYWAMHWSTLTMVIVSAFVMFMGMHSEYLIALLIAFSLTLAAIICDHKIPENSLF